MGPMFRRRIGSSVYFTALLFLVVPAPGDSFQGWATQWHKESMSGTDDAVSLASDRGTAGGAAERPPNRRLAVAWNDRVTGRGLIRAISTRPPWGFVTDELTIGRHAILRFAYGMLYVVSPTDQSIEVVDPDTWTIERSYRLGSGDVPLDIAVVDATTAYVTRRDATHLLRLDLRSGLSEEVIDFSGFADADGIPDLGTMVVHEYQLLVQIRRINSGHVSGFEPPAYLGVVDLISEQLIDVDPARSGVQAIQLEGTAPKLKMQIVPQTRRLFVSATGAAFDAGGIEVIDLDGMRSEGLVIREADGLTGVDLGPFALATPDRGYLAFTTDLTLSSHLQGFSLSQGVDPVPLHTVVDYLAPVLEPDPLTDSFFFPNSGIGDDGVHVFNLTTGERMTAAPVPTSGPPTDILLVCEPSSFLVVAVCMVFAGIRSRRGRSRRQSRRPPSRRRAHKDEPMRTHKPRTDPKGLDNPRDIEGCGRVPEWGHLSSGGVVCRGPWLFSGTATGRSVHGLCGKAFVGKEPGAGAFEVNRGSWS